jgi:hypothetical protein
MIRATLAVVPSRLPVLWAKLIVLVGLMLPLSLLAAAAEFFTASALESSRGGSAFSLTDPGVLREVVGASLYLTVIAVSGLALGALLRRTAAGLVVFAAVFLVVPLVAAYLPASIKGFAPYLPSNAGGTIWGAGNRPCLPPWPFGFRSLRSVTVTNHCLPSAWNGDVDNPSATSAIRPCGHWALSRAPRWATGLPVCVSSLKRSRGVERATVRWRDW